MKLIFCTKNDAQISGFPFRIFIEKNPSSLFGQIRPSKRRAKIILK